ncbi:MAG: hypothetical protein LQ338_006312 [Usnochroma carphineum]|nr:MAG: hypothetical protein LQ338_006312 [Usnochroma carphineum]
MLVHGAWHVLEHYTDFIQRLQKAGFEVHCPRLPTCDESKRPDADLLADVRTVRDQVMSLINQQRDVVMLLHSYGGAVGAEAVKGLSLRERATRGLAGGVSHLIYMCGFMLQGGESVRGASLPRPDPDPVAFDETTGTTCIRESPVQLFYDDVEPARAKELAGMLVPQDARAMSDTVTHPAWKYIPTTYLRTTEDEVLFLDWQDRQIKAVKDAGVDIAVETFKSSHSPYISIPEDMVDAVERAIQQPVPQ